MSFNVSQNQFPKVMVTGPSGFVADVNSSGQLLTTGTASSVTITVTNVSASGGISSTAQFIAATAGAGGITLTLPSAATINTEIEIMKVDSAVGTVTINTTGAQNINASLTYILSNQFQYMAVVSNGSNFYVSRNN